MKVKKIGIVDVSPEIAQDLIDKYPYSRQRPIDGKKVTQYAEAMKGGKFFPGTEIVIALVPNGVGAAGIIGNVCGHLINGNHRIRAVIESETTQNFAVKYVSCASEEEVALLYGVIDTHKKRNINDLFRALDLPMELGYTSYDMGRMSAAVAFIEENFGSTRRNGVPNERRLELVRVYSDIGLRYLELIKGAPGISHKVLRSQAILAVALITLDESARRYGIAKVEDFWMGIALDDGLKTGDPRKVALKHVNELMIQSSGRGPRHTSEYTARYMASCFAAWVEGRSITYTRVDDAGAPIRILGSHYHGK